MQIAIKTKLVIILAKLISIGFVILSFWVTVSPLAWGSTGIIYVAIMLIENTAFVASFSPMTIFLIPLATKLMNADGIVYIVLGYGSAMGGNMLSFMLGRAMSVRTEYTAAPFSILAVFGTYWHPQLASLTAFGAGARDVLLRRFLTATIPVSALYYFSVATAIYAAGGTITSVVSSDVFLVAILAVWLIWDVFQLFSILRARR